MEGERNEILCKLSDSPVFIVNDEHEYPAIFVLHVAIFKRFERVSKAN